jgi:hypothetical protein
MGEPAQLIFGGIGDDRYDVARTGQVSQLYYGEGSFHDLAA